MKSQIIATIMAKVSDAEANFRGRWNLETLKKVNPELSEKFDRQSQNYQRALLIGGEADIEDEGAAMVRGWHAIFEAMAAAAQEDDAYLVGFDDATGRRIVISEHPASLARADELEGNVVAHLKPDEIARMFFGLNQVSSVKAIWPKSEVIKCTTPET